MTLSEDINIWLNEDVYICQKLQYITITACMLVLELFRSSQKFMFVWKYHYVQEATESDTIQRKHFVSNVQPIVKPSLQLTIKYNVQPTIDSSSVQSDDVSAQSAPFLQIIYSENDVDSSYKEKESETLTNISSAWCIIGYVWSMTLSELNIISEGKKEMVTSNSNVKSIYDFFLY